jgi:hypothetical protein
MIVSEDRSIQTCALFLLFILVEVEDKHEN